MYFQLKTVLRLTHEDLEHVTVHGNSLLLRSLQSATKSLAKYNFDHIFSPDATQVRLSFSSFFLNFFLTVSAKGVFPEILLSVESAKWKFSHSTIK